ncbi:MAG: hypothetical protein HY060_01365 [Proteobacteria bacterium]|nr:hypothetical protein [Pseudomonadota bacterium]
MSALGHYLETEGVPTVAISLVRPQTERTRPPRALWVPFELGRPFGPPNDPAFQKRVVLAALRLLEAPRGPVLIEDFVDDDPRARPDPAWRPPVAATVPAGAAAALASELEVEAPLLARAYDTARAARAGRTTVGLSGLRLDAAVRYIADFLRGKPMTSPVADVSAALLLRWAADDLKAYYTEAAAAEGGKPSSRQIGDWFWNQTAAGAALQTLRAQHLASPDDRLKLIATMFLVPGARVPPSA